MDAGLTGTGADEVAGGDLQALDAALRAGAHKHALAVFRARLASLPAPALLAWIGEGWAGFATTERAVLMEAVNAARVDGTAAAVLMARAAYGAGHREAALAAARAALEREPARAEPAFLLCAMLLKQGSAEAQRMLRHCLDRFPQPSPGWGDLGGVLLGLGQRDAALVCLLRGMVDAASAVRCGLLARDLGRREQARAAFTRATRLDPASSRAWFLLGTAAQDGRDFVAAAAAYRTVLDLAPETAEAAVNLGTVLQESGDLAGARAAYGRAVVTRPGTFGRVAQALSTSPRGELWLDLEALRSSLVGPGAPGPE